MFGFLNINKPKGMTSHDVVAVLRRITKIKQIGHTGTLDPFATGVLPICIGKATRLIEFLADDKAYIATVRFGSNTDTYDIEGQITQSFDKKITQQELESILPKFSGEIEQLPPIYSAIKVNGKKLYEYARKGEEVEIKPRKVNIFELKLKIFDYENQCAQLFVKCSAGTYIRSLAFDIGKELNCGAHLTDLTRTKAGNFSLDKTINLEDLSIEQIQQNIINPLTILNNIKIEATEHDLTKIKNGVALRDKKIPNNETILITYQNKICAVGFSEDNIIILKKVFL